MSTTQRRAALIAGWSLIVMTAFWLFADWFVFQRITVAEDAVATAGNIVASEVRFRLGIFSVLVVLVCDILVAWGLYLFFKPADQDLSLLAAWLRLIYGSVLGVALASLVSVLTLLEGAGSLGSNVGEVLGAEALLSVDTFFEVWGLGLIVFGLHLVVLGCVALKSDFTPRLLGVLLLAAGLGYVADYAGELVMPTLDTAVSGLFGWGELIFAFWLLWRGGRVAG